MISIRRLSKLLSCPEHKSECKHPSYGQSCVPNPSPCPSEGQTVIDADQMAIFFQDASCVWSSSNKEECCTVLSRITMNLPKGLLVAIIGEVFVITLCFFSIKV